MQRPQRLITPSPRPLLNPFTRFDYALSPLVPCLSSPPNGVPSPADTHSYIPLQHHTTVAVIGTLIMGAFLHGLSPSIASARHTVMEVVLGVSYSRWAMEAISIQVGVAAAAAAAANQRRTPYRRCLTYLAAMCHHRALCWGTLHRNSCHGWWAPDSYGGKDGRTAG